MGDHHHNDQQPEKYLYRLNDNGQGPELLLQVFMERGWVEFDEETHSEDEWHLWWRTSRFRNSDYDILKPWQQMNHYPRSTAITKKDSLARNLKRMRGVYGPGIYNFSPVAFNLPNDYTKFVAEYSRMKEQSPNKDFCWICKPADLSRGRGIFIFRDLSELQYDCNAVVQQYLTNPMLISGYKFDLRIYVMVPSFHPLKVFIYQEGLVRFGTEKFDINTLGNMFAHLTNTSINKHSPSYTADKERVGPGCKWTLTQLRHYFRQANIDDQLLWQKIINIVVLTLALQANQVPKVSNCFELYGFDVIIDDQLKPWLLEVNFSPALSSDCQTDLVVKKPMLHDLFDFLNFPELETLRQRAESASRQSVRGRTFSAKDNLGSKSVSRLLAKSTGRLPHINSGGAQILNQGVVDSGVGGGSDDEGEEADGHSVVPVMPGCGLPSVQGPKTWRMGELASSRGSSASSHKSWENPDGVLSESRSSSVMSQRGLKRVDSKGSHFYKMAGDLGGEVKDAGLKQNKRESKLSLQSDSGVSSLSGSSETTDNSQPTDQQPQNLRNPLHSQSSKNINRNRKLSQSDIKSKSVTKMAGNHRSLHSPNPSQKGENFRNTSPLTSTGLMSRYALTDLSDVGLPNLNGTSLEKNGTPPRPLPRSTRSSALRSSYHAESKKKYGQFGYTANPLTGKTAMFNRRGSFNNHVLHHHHTSRQAPNYNRPWRKTNVQESYLVRETIKPTPAQVGDFFLVYPFNDTTRKCSAGNQDMKVIIREMQKLIKEQSACKGESLSPKIFDGLIMWGALDSGS